ncbi:MAG: DUF192 domain-containing protein [Rhodospirillales bacterium]|nr:DUF192 domain-containing protein [Rhodospirillales bacterium]
MIRFIVLLLLVSFIVRTAAAIEFERSRLIIATQDGAHHEIAVELAETDEQHMQGLMFRQSLALDEGMLFLYQTDRIPQMWMRNTPIPLDMLFLSGDGEVLATANNAVPYSEAIISPGIPAAAVLELNGNAIEVLGIEPGDRVEHPRLSGGR